MNRYKSSGYTLIELMIVVAIIGILSAVSIGIYSNYVIAANRTDARAALTETATSLEKCRALYSAYDSANCNVTLPFTSVEGLYEITGTTVTTSTFTLTATPVAGKAQANDTDCTSLTLTNVGIQSGAGADASQCW